MASTNAMELIAMLSSFNNYEGPTKAVVCKVKGWTDQQFYSAVSDAVDALEASAKKKKGGPQIYSMTVAAAKAHGATVHGDAHGNEHVYILADQRSIIAHVADAVDAKYLSTRLGTKISRHSAHLIGTGSKDSAEKLTGSIEALTEATEKVAEAKALFAGTKLDKGTNPNAVYATGSTLPSTVLLSVV